VSPPPLAAAAARPPGAIRFLLARLPPAPPLPALLPPPPALAGRLLSVGVGGREPLLSEKCAEARGSVAGPGGSIAVFGCSRGSVTSRHCGQRT